MVRKGRWRRNLVLGVSLLGLIWISACGSGNLDQQGGDLDSIQQPGRDDNGRDDNGRDDNGRDDNGRDDNGASDVTFPNVGGTCPGPGVTCPTGATAFRGTNLFNNAGLGATREPDTALGGMYLHGTKYNGASLNSSALSGTPLGGSTSGSATQTARAVSETNGYATKTPASSGAGLNVFNAGNNGMLPSGSDLAPSPKGNVVLGVEGLAWMNWENQTTGTINCTLSEVLPWDISFTNSPRQTSRQLRELFCWTAAKYVSFLILHKSTNTFNQIRARIHTAHMYYGSSSRALKVGGISGGPYFNDIKTWNGMYNAAAASGVGDRELVAGEQAVATVAVNNHTMSIDYMTTWAKKTAGGGYVMGTWDHVNVANTYSGIVNIVAPDGARPNHLKAILTNTTDVPFYPGDPPMLGFNQIVNDYLYSGHRYCATRWPEGRALEFSQGVPCNTITECPNVQYLPNPTWTGNTHKLCEIDGGGCHSDQAHNTFSDLIMIPDTTGTITLNATTVLAQSHIADYGIPEGDCSGGGGTSGTGGSSGSSGSSGTGGSTGGTGGSTGGTGG